MATRVSHFEPTVVNGNASFGISHQNVYFSSCPPGVADSFSLESLIEDDSSIVQPCSPSSSWFHLLKSKILNTDKLILRYQAKTRKAKELQTSLTGFKNDFKLLHQENEKHQSTIAQLKEELEVAKNVNEEQKIYIEQLKAKVDELEIGKETKEALLSWLRTAKKEKKTLQTERDGLRKDNKKLKQKLKLYLSESKGGASTRDLIKKREKEKVIMELEEELNKLGKIIAEDNSEGEEIWEDTIEEMGGVNNDIGGVNKDVGGVDKADEVGGVSDNVGVVNTNTSMPVNSLNMPHLPGGVCLSQKEPSRGRKRSGSECSNHDDEAVVKRVCLDREDDPLTIPSIASESNHHSNDNHHSNLHSDSPHCDDDNLHGNSFHSNNNDNDNIHGNSSHDNNLHSNLCDDINLHDDSSHSNNNDNSIHGNDNEISFEDYDQMICSLEDTFSLDHTHRTSLSPLPPSPPPTPLPSFDFYDLRPVTPLPLSPRTLPVEETTPTLTTPLSPPLEENNNPIAIPVDEQLIGEEDIVVTDESNGLPLPFADLVIADVTSDRIIYGDDSAPLSPAHLSSVNNGLIIEDKGKEVQVTVRGDDTCGERLEVQDHTHSFPDNDVSHGNHPNNQQVPISLEDGELMEGDNEEGVTMETLMVGYAAPPTKATPTSKVVKSLSTDGATGQWMKDHTSNSTSSSRSTSPLLGSMTCEFPSVGVSQGTSLTPPTSQSPPTQPVCQSQQLLKEYYQCPKPLPPWLVEAILPHQDEDINVKGKIKKPNRVRPRSQKVAVYLFNCLNAATTGKLPLSKCVEMLCDEKNGATGLTTRSSLIKLVKTKYYPNFESVMKLCWSRCSGVVGGVIDPLNPNYVPPLPLLESTMVSLVLNITQLRPDLPSFLSDILQGLRECILSSDWGFHDKCVFCRLYSSFCRVMADIDQVQFLICELLLQSMELNALPLVVAVVSVWPRAFSRSTSGPALFVNGSVSTKGLEYQPISFTIETVMSCLATRHSDHTLQKGPISNARILCKWEMVPPNTVQSLVVSFIEVLKLSPYVKIETPPTNPNHPNYAPKPRPSKHAYAIVMALRVIAACQGWSWTNDMLIRQHLWPILQSWNKQASSIRAETIVCVVRLLGFIGQKGLINDPNSPSIQLLLKMFAMILQKEAKAKVPIPIQLAVADALLDMRVPSKSALVSSTILSWTKQLMKDNATAQFAMEYCGQVSSKETG